MKKIYVSAPGKLHLLGEHVVVYNKPAIIAAVNKRCFVTIIPRKDRKVEIISPNLKAQKVLAQKEIIDRTESAQKAWENWIKTNDINILKSITSDPLDYVVIVVGEVLKHLKKTFSSGFTLSIKSDIPIGSGMGSSAAIAVSVVGAVSLLFNKTLDKETINEIAYLAEQKKHGLPSGGDNAASCFGGMVWYRKETPDLKIIKPIPFPFPKKLAKNFIAIHTGTPSESTGEMVGMVRALYQKNPQLIDGVLSSQEKLTRELLSAIKTGDNTLIINIIREGEKNLESIGVVSESAQSIIRSIEKVGGAAKICGGGGIQKGSGMVLAYCTNKKSVEKLARSNKFAHIDLSLGAEGLREEKHE